MCLFTISPTFISHAFNTTYHETRYTRCSNADDLINIHNSGNHTYTLGHNEYSHLTWEEFREAKNLGRPMPPKPFVGLSRGESNKHTEGGPPPFAGEWGERACLCQPTHPLLLVATQ